MNDVDPKHGAPLAVEDVDIPQSEGSHVLGLVRDRVGKRPRHHGTGQAQDRGQQRDRQELWPHATRQRKAGQREQGPAKNLDSRRADPLHQEHHERAAQARAEQVHEVEPVDAFRAAREDRRDRDPRQQKWDQHGGTDHGKLRGLDPFGREQGSVELHDRDHPVGDGRGDTRQDAEQGDQFGGIGLPQARNQRDQDAP